MRRITTTFSYTGATQTFRIPNAVSNVFIQTWGAAGGSQGGLGGPGGYSQGSLGVTPNNLLTVLVGQGGIPWSVSQTTCLLPTFGGGGGGGNAVGEQFKGSSAGGRSAVRNSSNTEIITAGGGGGSSSSWAEAGTINGGPGGGTNGVDGYVSIACYNVAMGKGGTQSAGGAGGSGFSAFNNGGVGTQFNGGTGGGGSNGGLSAGAAGGGGGGYFGGGGGAGEYQAGLGCPISAGAQDCAGGGGSGFIGGVTSGLTAGSTTPGTSPWNPPGTTLPNYVSGVGVARSASVGGNGLVVFTYTVPTLTKTVDKSNATIGDILTYTLVLDNTSGVTLNNIVFVDTIANGTAFLPGTFSVNGVTSPASPAPPGANIGNISTVVTISYQVQVTTVPTPNPIPNVGSISADNLDPTISNSVATQINYLNLTSSKIVNKAYGNIGDILTYTIPITNRGNSTANSILFLDTIPSGTTYVAGSLKQDNTAVTGSSNTPGVTLPNALGVGRVTTVTFQVLVNTIPCPNPIPNSAAATGVFNIDTTTTPTRTGASSTNTNIVNTQINNANLGNIKKYVSNAFADCGQIITYTIEIPNSGNVTAQNILFKDTIPTGTVFVANSVTINNTPQSGVNPATGITVPNISPGTTTTLTFNVQVIC